MDTIGTKEEELLSYGRATIVADIMFAGFFGLSLLELCLFLIYNYFVSNFSCYFDHYKFDIFLFSFILGRRSLRNKKKTHQMQMNKVTFPLLKTILIKRLLQVR